jgi:exopolysaccharide biosynthesis predicted pyruvyltransferase EpsI
MSDKNPVFPYAAQLRDSLAKRIPRDRPVALLGFSETGNCSDHATWLGETKLLGEIGVSIAYRASAQTYQRESFAVKTGKGTILLHGGRFGEHPPVDREFRLRVLQDFPNKTILLPQHVSSIDSPGVESVAAAVAKHPDTTIFAASRAAKDMLGRYFDAKQIELAPDAAFFLTAQNRPRDALYDVLWLARTGRRQNDQAELAARLSSQAAEKSVLPRFHDGVEISLVVKQRPPTVLLTDWSSLVFESQEARLAYHALDFDARARAYLDRALYILSLGRIVITDRVRAHILCLLLGIPHILLDDDSGKNRDFYESWSNTANLCHFALSAAEAWALARNASPLVKEGSNSAWSW